MAGIGKGDFSGKGDFVGKGDVGTGDIGTGGGAFDGAKGGSNANEATGVGSFNAADSSGPGDTGGLRFDGYYQYAHRFRYFLAFLFFPNGTVAGFEKGPNDVLSTEDIRELLERTPTHDGNTWERDMYGKYTVNGNRITFHTDTEPVDYMDKDEHNADYDGIIQKKALIMDICHNGNGSRKKKQKFKFISW